MRVQSQQNNWRLPTTLLSNFVGGGDFCTLISAKKIRLLASKKDSQKEQIFCWLLNFLCFSGLNLRENSAKCHLRRLVLCLKK